MIRKKLYFRTFFSEFSLTLANDVLSGSLPRTIYAYLYHRLMPFGRVYIVIFFFFFRLSKKNLQSKNEQQKYRQKNDSQDCCVDILLLSNLCLVGWINKDIIFRCWFTDDCLLLLLPTKKIDKLLWSSSFLFLWKIKKYISLPELELRDLIFKMHRHLLPINF